MKYSVKFTNGYWKVFNNETYEDVQLCTLLSEATSLAAKLNSKKQ